jgi:hypothetical protein
MLVLLQVAFRLHLSLFNEEVLVDVLVDSELGFYFFLGATMTSLIVGHLLLAFHRHVVTHVTVRPGGPVEALSMHAFTVHTVQGTDAVIDANDPLAWSVVMPCAEPQPSFPALHNQDRAVQQWSYVGHMYESEVAPTTDHLTSHLALRVQCSALGRWLTTVAFVVALALLIWGSVADTFAFRVKGLAGLILSTTDQSTTYYSAVSLGLSLQHSARNPGSVGLYWVQVRGGICVSGREFSVTVSVPHIALLSIFTRNMRQDRSTYVFECAWADVCILCALSTFSSLCAWR